MADNLAERTAEIVAAYVEANKIKATDLPKIITTVHDALSGLGQPAEDEPETVAKLTAAQVRKSITPDKLISFIDGKGYRLLKRHLSAHGLTPAAYRERFGLPKDYPIVAPSYSAARSELAKSTGLGTKRWKADATKPPAGASVTAGKAPPATKVAAKPAKAVKARPAKATDSTADEVLKTI
jgi:predicted transcriptional regulator